MVNLVLSSKLLSQGKDCLPNQFQTWKWQDRSQSEIKYKENGTLHICKIAKLFSKESVYSHF